MFVTLDTLNAYGLKVKDDKSSNNEETIANLVTNNEGLYLDMCLSVALNDELTDDTKGDDRFTALINQVSFDDGKRRSVGLDKGANYYIYSLWLRKQFTDLTSSGMTVTDPLNGSQINPNDYYRTIHNVAAQASCDCLEIIDANIEDYEEFTEATGLSKIHPFL